MLNVNRLPNSTRLEIAATIAEEVFDLELDEEAFIHELRRYGFTQAYAEAMTYRYVAQEQAEEAPSPAPKRQYQRKKLIAATSCPEYVFVNNVLMKVSEIRA